MIAVARVEPSPEQLRDAFAVVRLPSWPADYEEAMRDGVRLHLVRAAAVRIALGLRVATAVPPVHARPAVVRPDPPARRNTPHVPVPHPTHDLFDRKRLAAGERDDD